VDASSTISNSTEMSVCAAIAMSAVEHHPICQGTDLCTSVALVSRDSIPFLYAINLVDLIIEAFSLIALLLCAFTRLGGIRAGGPLLFLMLIADVALEILAIRTASSIHPTIKSVKDSNCLDLLLADGRTVQETLVKIENDLDAVVKLGYVELVTAVVASAGDLSDIYAGMRKHMSSRRRYFRALALFLPALLDALLATLDFFIFTTSASQEAAELRQSIVNRTAVWCVTITDDCIPILEEENARLNLERPSEANYDPLVVAVSVSIGAVTLLYSFACMIRSRKMRRSETTVQAAPDPRDVEISRLQREVEQLQAQVSTSDGNRQRVSI
jgi:hypothetical protein